MKKRFIFYYYNHSPFGLSSHYSFIEVKASTYSDAASDVAKLLPSLDADGQKIAGTYLLAVLEADNPFILPEQPLFSAPSQ